MRQAATSQALIRNTELLRVFFGLNWCIVSKPTINGKPKFRFNRF
jgi:hypothetical protein